MKKILVLFCLAIFSIAVFGCTKTDTQESEIIQEDTNVISTPVVDPNTVIIIVDPNTKDLSN